MGMDRSFPLTGAELHEGDDLRHCFGTRSAERLIRDGMSRESAQEAIMRIMGHVSRVTSDRYVKLAAETLRDIIE